MFFKSQKLARKEKYQIVEETLNKKNQKLVSDQSDKEFSKEFQEIHSRIDGVTSALTQLITENGEFQRQVEKIMNIFPIRNLNDINKTEEILKNPQQMNIIAKELSRLGGGTVKEITKRIMFRIINNETAQLYSWEGQKGKQKFKDLLLGKLIIKAVRLNEKTKEASEADIIKPLREWLVRAKFRRVQSNSQPDDAADL
ncbi:hypothetical protein RN001_002218 [Aquatica leii]|uniref:DUF4806 domain-containing protein n=1 Tax=Aquatica leii TaxID=1421715 RepID=A0AAN7SK09_9COLE|nr:hypothetical protein RN001_002218 [Aquatica leii]